MSTTTYTLECDEHGKSQRTKYSNLGNLVEYETYPEHVEFHLKASQSGRDFRPRRNGNIVVAEWDETYRNHINRSRSTTMEAMG